MQGEPKMWLTDATDLLRRVEMILRDNTPVSGSVGTTADIAIRKVKAAYNAVVDLGDEMGGA